MRINFAHSKACSGTYQVLRDGLHVLACTSRTASSFVLDLCMNVSELCDSGLHEKSWLSHLKSPSDDDANIHVSPSFLPKRDPAGSVSITYWMALPIRPVPPVTSITSGMMLR